MKVAMEAVVESYLWKGVSIEYNEALSAVMAVNRFGIARITVVGDLELKLQREPEFVEVFNELKVANVSLALTNMEKEQAIFALKLERQANTPSSREPSSLGVNM